jgi:hypothetical protein
MIVPSSWARRRCGAPYGVHPENAVKHFHAMALAEEREHYHAIVASITNGMAMCRR